MTQGTPETNESDRTPDGAAAAIPTHVPAEEIAAPAAGPQLPPPPVPASVAYHVDNYGAFGAALAAGTIGSAGVMSDAPQPAAAAAPSATDMARLEAGELLREFMAGTDPARIIAARVEIASRLVMHQTLMAEPALQLVRHLVPVIKPSCRVCVKPATKFFSNPGISDAYTCDGHAPEGAKDLPAAQSIRLACAVAETLDRLPVPGAS